MPKCLRIIPRAKLTRIADLTKSTPEWNEHLKLLSAEGCLCIMQGEETDSEIRLITKDTGYVFTVTDFEMTKEKGEFLRGQLSSLLTLLEAENAISKYLNNDNTNDNR